MIMRLFLVVITTLTLLNACDDASYQTPPSRYYTVTFDTNISKYGTDYKASKVSAQKVRYGARAEKPDDPTCDKAYFAGWYKDNTTLNVWDFREDTVQDNITLYGKWELGEVIYNEMKLDVGVSGLSLPGQGPIVRKAKHRFLNDNISIAAVDQGDFAAYFDPGSKELVITAVGVPNPLERRIPADVNKVRMYINVAFYINETGDATTPYRITNQRELELLREMPLTPNTYLELGDNFTLSGNWVPLETFSSRLDGKGHTIDGLNISVSDKAGLFRELNGATVSNFTISGTVNGGSASGILAGSITDSMVSSVCTSGSVVSSGQYAGGLIGMSEFSTVELNCSEASVSAANDAGGLVGYAHNSRLIGNYATGNVNIGGNNAGGLIGVLTGTDGSAPIKSSLLSSYALGGVTAGGNNAGGLIGYVALADVQDVYAAGDISAVDNAGGLYGFGTKGVFTHGYAMGAVTAVWDAGGLYGELHGDNASGIFNNITVISQSIAFNPTVNGDNASRVGRRIPGLQPGIYNCAADKRMKLNGALVTGGGSDGISAGGSHGANIDFAYRSVFMLDDYYEYSLVRWDFDLSRRTYSMPVLKNVAGGVKKQAVYPMPPHL